MLQKLRVKVLPPYTRGHWCPPLLSKHPRSSAEGQSDLGTFVVSTIIDLLINSIYYDDDFPRTFFSAIHNHLLSTFISKYPFNLI